jgi:hypothetical protein
MEIVIIAALMLTVGWIMILLHAAKESLLWAIICFVFPPMALVYSILNWMGTKLAFFLMVGGYLVGVGAIIAFAPTVTEEEMRLAEAEITKEIVLIKKTPAELELEPAEWAELGVLVSCSNSIKLYPEFAGRLEKYPVSWLGVTECKFARQQRALVVEVSQSREDILTLEGIELIYLEQAEQIDQAHGKRL